jgi:L-lactate dehydrogenase complex protein LldG
MTHRDDILNRLRAQEREATHPPAWRSGRRFTSLADRFYRSLTAVAGEVRRAANLAEALQELDSLLWEIKPQQVAVNDEPPLTSLDLPSRWPNLQWYVVGQSEGDLRAFCATADVGISGAEAALAETGTVIIHSGPGRSRLVSLLPPVHIALLSTAKLTPDLFTWTSNRRGDLPSSVTLISGPSKTADIEQTLAIGVHGPKRFLVILYDEEK